MTENSTRAAFMKFAFLIVQLGFVILLVTTVTGLLTRSMHVLTGPAEADAARRAEIEQLNQRFITLNVEVRRLRQELTVIATAPTLPQDVRMKALEAQLTDVIGREQRIEQAIEQNPAKSIELPILRHDVDDLKERYIADAAARKDDVQRIYELNKWFVGLVISAVVALVTLAITSYFKPQELRASGADRTKDSGDTSSKP